MEIVLYDSVLFILISQKHQLGQLKPMIPFPYQKTFDEVLL